MSKVCVIGLDGGTFKIIDYLIGQGRMPNFARLRSQGSKASLISTIPPLTPAAWGSFFTGSNPGKTGAVGFFRFRPGTYRLEPMNAGNLHGTPFWSLASEGGKRVCVCNVPVTYPAVPVNGILISGMDAPAFDDRAIYPLEYKNTFLSAIPDFKVSCEIDARYLIKHVDDPLGEGIRQMQAHLDMEIRTINHLMGIEDWDLFVAVIRSTDVLQHFFWQDVEKLMANDSVEEDVSKKAEAVFACYETIDRELGEQWSGWCKNKNMIILSDHGFGSLRADICLNRVLANAGLVKFLPRNNRKRYREFLVRKLQTHLPARTRHKIKRLVGREEVGKRWHLFVDSLVSDIDWEQTRLFSIAQFGCFYVNLKGRDPLGTVVGEKERQAVLAAAEEALSNLKDPNDGLPLVTAFYRKEDVYEGPLLDAMPDIVVNFRDWSYRGICSTSEELSDSSIFRSQFDAWGPFGYTGTHRLEGILMMNGPDIAAADLGKAQMVDLAPTIMNLLGLPPLAGWDGRILEEAFTGGASVAQPGGKAHASADSEDNRKPVYSEEDEEEIRKRLENLGYL